MDVHFPLWQERSETVRAAMPGERPLWLLRIDKLPKNHYNTKKYFHRDVYNGKMYPVSMCSPYAFDAVFFGILRLLESGTSSESQTDEGTDNEISETDEGTGTDESTETDVAAATVEETVMWDNEDIKITAQSLTSDNSFYILNLQIENKTAEDLYMMASRCAVNGFVAEPVMSVDVPANSTTEGEVKFYRKDVYRDVVADIKIRFHYNSKKTERVKLETSAAASFDYSYDESGTLLYDENGIKIVCEGFTDDGNPIIYLYSTGELSEGCVVGEYEIYINGKKARADFCNWVFPHTRNVAEMDISDKDIDGNELGDVESIQVSFKISKENMADPHPVKTQLLEIPVK